MSKVIDYTKLDWSFEHLPEVKNLSERLKDQGYSFSTYRKVEVGIANEFIYSFESNLYGSAIICVTEILRNDSTIYDFDLFIGGLWLVLDSDLYYNSYRLI